MGNGSDPPVVALVCSTGGLDAVSSVLGPLPAEFPAAVIVLQHRSPDIPDRLTPIIKGRTAMPVASACDGDALLPGHVLVAPAGYHTLVTHDRAILLIESGERPPYRPSADLLLTSMALAVGRRAVAVVLSGYGNDGATGATAVHRCGGVVIASDEATSAAFVMPAATINRDDVVDHVTALEDIPVLLLALLAHERAAEPFESASYAGPDRR